MLESFRERLSSSTSSAEAGQAFSLPSLLQATLDVEFVTQILGSQYTTEKAQGYQQTVYQVLDKGSNDEARAGLQRELATVRNILQKERKATRLEL